MHLQMMNDVTGQFYQLSDEFYKTFAAGLKKQKAMQVDSAVFLFL